MSRRGGACGREGRARRWEGRKEDVEKGGEVGKGEEVGYASMMCYATLGAPTGMSSQS